MSCSASPRAPPSGAARRRRRAGRHGRRAARDGRRVRRLMALAQREEAAAQREQNALLRAQLPAMANGHEAEEPEPASRPRGHRGSADASPQLEGIYDPQTGEHVGFSTPGTTAASRSSPTPTASCRTSSRTARTSACPPATTQLDLSAPSGVAELRGRHLRGPGRRLVRGRALRRARRAPQPRKSRRSTGRRGCCPPIPSPTTVVASPRRWKPRPRKLEAMMGRRLTLDERRDIGQEVVDTVARGRPVDVEDAASRLAIEDRGGIRHGSLDNDQERHDYYASRLRDERPPRQPGAPRRRRQHRRCRRPTRSSSTSRTTRSVSTYMTQRALGQEAYAVEPAEDS